MNPLKIVLESLDSTYRLDFARPAVEVATRGGAVLEALAAALSKHVLVASKDLRFRGGPTVGDAAMSMQLYNGYATIEVNADRLVCSYRSLRGVSDMKVAADATTLAAAAVGEALPSVAILRESLSGDVSFDVQDGPQARQDYFSRLSFPGLGAHHRDASVKFRVRGDWSETEYAVFEIAPLWSSDRKIFVHFEVPVGGDRAQALSGRLITINNFVSTVLGEMELDVQDPQSVPGAGR